jgi:hypothetical protein
MTAAARSATITETLVDYEGPQLLLLKTNRGYHMIAVAISNDYMDEPFFGCEINDKTFDGYFQQTWDLHYTFRHAVGHRYYLFDSDGVDHSVDLEVISDEKSLNDSYWPQVGFFSRSHTTPYNRKAQLTSEKTFRIDGKWDASDFSHFHSKMADLYALFGVILRLGKDQNNSATEKGYVEKVIHDRFWRGGGSYVSFYDSLMERNATMQLARLDVAKIQYASPGEMTFRGNKGALSSVTAILTIFEEDGSLLEKEYKNIYGILKKERLLSAVPEGKFSSPHIKNIVLSKSKNLFEEMGMENFQELFEACAGNVLVFAKLVLSIYRRGRDLFKYQDEARVQKA